ncbi:MAG TPA: NAD(P)/FAD-dependent oxidoreductase [Acidimicrobiia bacterium]|nr:NAD(P)/FAD-dependent oxidoreductase [Acidimicrobiia bacterium]
MVDVVVVGAGFAGLYSLYRLREAGWSVQGFEAGDGVGGTWYWNRYPGARCDVASIEYSYSFSDELQQEWDWSERYATQPEILRYLDHVADRFDLRRLIRFETRVEAAVFDETTGGWAVRTSDGEVTRARFVVMATGCLSTANMPDIPGRDSFAGEVLHTGRWPHHPVEFAGKRVGVIGTGSSAIQAIPVIAEAAAGLVVFQRTPNYSVPAHNHRLQPADLAAVKTNYSDLRERNRRTMIGAGGWATPPGGPAFGVSEDERERILEERWADGGLWFLTAFNDVVFNGEANDVLAEFVRRKIRATVADPAVADRLSPTQRIGCKRLCVDTGYFETFNRPNVRLIDLREFPIEAITSTGVRTVAEHIELDSLVFATGFDAMTGTLMRIDIRGRGGVSLRTAWAEGPRTYLGLGVPGFPNLFLVTGPGSPSVLTNMVTSIEHHVEWIGDCLDHLRAEGYDAIEASPEAAEEWGAYVNAVAGTTLFTTCNSWYLGANIPGKPRVFMPLFGFAPYVATCDDVAADNYRGFELLTGARGRT